MAQIERLGPRVAGIHAQQQAARAGGAGMRDGMGEQAQAGPAALPGPQQVDALEFQVADRVGPRQVGPGHHRIAHGRAARRRFGQPERGVGVVQPGVVPGRGMRPAAVLDDPLTVQDAREALKEGGRAHKGECVGIAGQGAADRRFRAGRRRVRVVVPPGVHGAVPCAAQARARRDGGGVALRAQAWCTSSRTKAGFALASAMRTPTTLAPQCRGSIASG